MAQQVQKFRALQGSFNFSDKKFVDISIPSGIGKVDLSKTDLVVKFDVATLSTGGLAADANPPVLDTIIRVKRTGVTDNHANFTPAALVRHCELRSQRLGVIESIRNVDLLRNTLKMYAEDDEDRERGFKRTHNASQKNFTNSNGVLDSVGKGNERSVNRTKDVAIPLHELFEYCKNPAYDTDKDGELFVHCEMNFPSVDVLPTNNDNAVFTNDAAGNGRNAAGYDFARAGGGNQVLGVDSEDDAHMKNIDLRSLPSSVALNPGSVTTGAIGLGLVYRTSAQYPDMRDCPFFVNQAVFIKVQSSTTPANAPQGLITLEGVIRRIEKANGVSVGTNLTTPSQASDAVDLTIAFVGGANGPAIPNGRLITSVTIELAAGAQNAAGNVGSNDSIAINDVELQVVIDPDNSAPSPYPFVTYMAEEDNYPASQNFNRNYDIPAGTRNVYILFTPQNSVSRENNLGSYRLTIDNEDVYGRVVNYNSTLHRDLINQVFTNRGDRVKSLDQKVFNNRTSRGGRKGGATNHGGPQGSEVRVIALPCPIKNDVQKLGVELAGFDNTGAPSNLAGRHVVYYERLVSK